MQLQAGRCIAAAVNFRRVHVSKTTAVLCANFAMQLLPLH
jgi:hypothetical protein